MINVNKMEDFFKELIEYTYIYNNRVIESLLLLNFPPEKSIQLINHTLNAHEIWNSRILEKEIKVGVWDIRNLSDLKEINHTNYLNSVSITESLDFNKILSYKNSKGVQFSNTIRDMLFHIVNHSTYHRGQIATDCKTHGISPLVTDYIFYKRDI